VFRTEYAGLDRRLMQYEQLTGNVTPPRGYTFIPAGDPQLTSKCRECARHDGAVVYKVSVSASTLERPNSC
jgi:hypothetical protein